MRPADVREHCKLGAAGQSPTKAAMRQLVMHLNGHPLADVLIYCPSRTLGVVVIPCGQHCIRGSNS
jgi:hypothetical protein